MNKHMVEFYKFEWKIKDTGIREKSYINGNQHIRLLELSEGFEEKRWCEKRHAGYVMEGGFSCDFSGNIEQYEKGDMFYITGKKTDLHKAVLGKGEKALLLMFESE